MGNLFCIEEPDLIEYVTPNNLTEMMDYMKQYNASEKFLEHISNIEKKYTTFMIYDKYNMKLSETLVMIIVSKLVFDVFKKYGTKPFVINENIISFIVYPENFVS